MTKAPASPAATGLPKPMTEAELLKFLQMLGENYRHLEFSIPDLRNATIVMETMCDDALKNPEEFHQFKRFDLTEDQWDGLSYAIRHVGNLARELSKTFYRGFEAPLDESASS